MFKLILPISFLLAGTAFAGEPVTVENFVRAETDNQIRKNMAATGIQIGRFGHLREPTTPENQPVIRMNQDTLYSATLVDLSKPVKITLPEVDGRYMSMHVINQDHYMFAEATPGTYELTEDLVGTRFAWVSIRTFVDVSNPDDIAKVHAAQDALEISGGGTGPIGFGGVLEFDDLRIGVTGLDVTFGESLDFEIGRAHV